MGWCVAREGDTTVQQNRTEEKRMFRKKQQLLPHLPFFDTMRVTHTISVTVESKNLYIRNIPNYHVVSFQSNKYLCLSYIYLSESTELLYSHNKVKSKLKKKKKKKNKKKKKILKKKKKKKKKK